MTLDPALTILNLTAEIFGRHPVTISRCGEKVHVRVALSEADYADGWGYSTTEALECAKQFREENEAKWKRAHDDSIRAKEQAARVDALTDKLCGMSTRI